MPDSCDSFEQFYQAEYDNMVRYVTRLGGAAGDADDVVQEVMLQVLDHWDRLTNPRAWARRAVRHTLIRLETKWRRQGEIAEALGRSHRVDTPQTTGETHRGAEKDSYPGETAFVLRLLRRLSPAQREVMACCLDGYEPDEIASLIGKLPATVRSNLREARKTLRRLWREYGREDPPHERRRVEES